MPDFASSDITIYVDEFWYECDEYEKEELIDLIEEEGLVKRIDKDKIKRNENSSPMEKEFFESCDVILNSYVRMSLEEIEIIHQLAKKYKI